jgi:hypothetical protein
MLLVFKPFFGTQANKSKPKKGGYSYLRKNLVQTNKDPLRVFITVHIFSLK